MSRDSPWELLTVLSTTHLYPQAEEHAGCCLQPSNSQPIFSLALRTKPRGWASPWIMLGCLSCLFIIPCLKFPSSQLSSHGFGTARHSPLALTSTYTLDSHHTLPGRGNQFTYRVELPQSWLIVGCATCKPGVCVVVVTPRAAGRARRRQSQ